MAAEGNEEEPKLTVKLRSEITEPEPFEYTVLKPAEAIVEPEDEEESNNIEMETEQTTVEPEDEEETFEETMDSADVRKVQEHKPQREKAKKSKVVNPTKSISRLHSELRKHSDARRKTDSAILDIRKELKDLLLVHHATIKDLKKQVSQMHKKISTIEKSRKSTRSKTTDKKTAHVKKTSSNKNYKSGQKKIRKR